jgi:heptosyltransferase I
MTAPALAELPAPQRVLLIKPSALGDVVTALPVLGGLRRTFPTAQLHWLVSTSCAAILQDEPRVDERVLFERKKLGRAWYYPPATASLWRFRRTLAKGQYDWVIDLQGLARSAIFARWTGAAVRAGFADAREGAPLSYTHRIETTAEHTIDRNIDLARKLGIDARGEDLRLSVSPAAAEQARAMLAEHLPAGGEYLLCVPPTRWATKQYPVRHWRRVVAELARDIPVVLTGSGGDRPLCGAIAADQPRGVIDLTGRSSLPVLTALIAAARGVLCCDSAAKFIAAAVETDCRILIGPTRAERTGPWGTGESVIAEVACQGCLQRSCPHISCMDSIAPARVVAAGREMIGAAR